MEKCVFGGGGGRGGGRGCEFCASSCSVGQTPPRVPSPLHPGSSKELPSSPTSSPLCLPLETDSMDCMHDIPAVWVAQAFFTASPPAHRAPKAQQPRGASTFMAPSSPGRSSAQVPARTQGGGGRGGGVRGRGERPSKQTLKSLRKIHLLKVWSALAGVRRSTPTLPPLLSRRPYAGLKRAFINLLLETGTFSRWTTRVLDQRVCFRVTHRGRKTSGRVHSSASWSFPERVSMG